MKRLEKVKKHGLFLRAEESKTRKHPFKVRGQRFERHLRGSFFTESMVYTWNELSDEVVEVGTITAFKRYLR